MIQNILLSPKGNPLLFDMENACFKDQNTEDIFEIREGVPILLPSKAEERCMEITLSNGVKAKFYYVDHYHQDAEVFDYFEAIPDGASQHENKRLHEMILSNIPKDISNILDVGCGNAWVAEHFANNNNKVSVVSMDISLANPLRAIKKYPFENHSAIVGDVYALPFQPHTFDCIIAAEVMEHTPDPTLFIENLLRILKPKGTLIITTPFNERIPHSLCVHCNRATPHNAHLHSFDQQKIKALLKGQAIESWKLNTFANKWLVKLRTHGLLQYFPFKAWKAIDNLANLLYFKPLRLLLKVTK